MCEIFDLICLMLYNILFKNILLFFRDMVENIDLVEQYEDGEIRHELDNLLLQKKTETTTSYPKTPQQVKSVLQYQATKKESEILGNKSVTERNDAMRGELTVIESPTWPYHYTLTSYWISTLFKFIPVQKNSSLEAGRLVVFFWLGEKEFFWVDVDSLKDSDVQEFLWWVNSINKLIALNSDYKKLDEEIPRLLKNKNNKANFRKYYATYQAIMNKEFSPPRVSTSFPMGDALKHMFWFNSNITAYTNERRHAIKAQKKTTLDRLFKEQGIP